MPEPRHVHLTARALPGTLLIHDWTEALEPWRRLRDAFPDASAVCLMPNPPHIVTPVEGAVIRLAGVMSGYARWRNHRRGQSGACWEPLPAPTPLPDDAHRRRTVRYVLLNPCRGELADDPLAWPLSTHRDLVGLGMPGIKVRDPGAFHAYVSGDPSVSVSGTPLPALVLGAPLSAVEVAVGAALRLPPGRVREDPQAIRLCVRAGAMTAEADPATLASWMGVSRSWVYRCIRDLPSRLTLDREPLLRAVLHVVGDPRFGPLVLAPRADPTRWSGWRVPSCSPKRT